jgi:AmmeMemoRadiSam system protein B/AmmeMemoRadiSam system protein A
MDSEVKTQDVRRSAWAGQFYPAAPSELSREIAALFAAAPKPAVDGDVVALVSPHAGYAYSGQVAARTYKAIEGHEYDTVIVVSPSHTKYFPGVSVYNGGSYETPLGELPTDVHMAKRLGRTVPGTIYLSNMGHTGGERAEHALEVQLPFLQIVLGSFNLVALVMGDQQSWRALGDALAAVASEKRVLLVASSDLSHYHDVKEAAKLDGHVRRAVESFDPAAVAAVIESGRGEACGAGPIMACMHAARKLGATRSVITGYAHSGEATGDTSSVVGYLGAAFVRDVPECEPKTYVIDAEETNDETFSAAQREELMRFARQGVAAAVHNSSVPDTSHASRPVRRKSGAFVTLKVGGQLRGCIGSVEGRLALVELVVQMAMAAATRDPRFTPVTAAELSQLELELSVLGPVVPCEETELIEIGRHGLVIVKGNRTGVLLPQVAAENGWDRAMFLRQVCLKAGLPAEAWRDSASTLYMFSAEVF